MPDDSMALPELIWVTGFSQGGTTLLMSLLDGHPDLLVYPDEPGFGKLFKRQDLYISSKHFIADFLFGTTNPLHFAQEAKTKNIKNTKYPATIEEDFSKIHKIYTAGWIEKKTLRGVAVNTFDHTSFFQKYHQTLLDMLDDCTNINPKVAVRMSFEALNKTCPSVNGKNRINVFKGPLSGVSFHKLDWFRKNYNGKIIFIHRNPHARLYSKMLHLHKKGRPESGPRLNESFLGFLRFCMANARHYSESNKIFRDEDIVSVYYEDLVTDSEKTMRYICNTLKIPFNDVLLIPTKLGYKVKNPTDRTGHDGSITNKSLYKYKKELTQLEKYIFSFFLCLYELFDLSIFTKKTK